MLIFACAPELLTLDIYAETAETLLSNAKKKFLESFKLFFVFFLDDDEMSNAVEFKAKLDKIMYQKGQDLENKRMIMVKKQMEIGNVQL